MVYSDAAEMVAEWLVLHDCGYACKCDELRQIPAIQEVLARMGAPPWLKPANGNSAQV